MRCFQYTILHLNEIIANMRHYIDPIFTIILVLSAMLLNIAEIFIT